MDAVIGFVIGVCAGFVSGWIVRGLREAIREFFQ